MYVVNQNGFGVFTKDFEQVILCFEAAVLVYCVPALTL